MELKQVVRLSRICLGCGLLLLAGDVLRSQSQPNFSGIWQLDGAKSTPFSGLETIWIRIEHSGSTFLVNQRNFYEGKPEENETGVYAIGEVESSGLTHGAPTKSHASWDGQTLEIRSVAMFGNQPLKLTDRWTLSQDGSTLAMHEVSQFGKDPQQELLFNFERRAAKDWPVDNSSQPAEKQYLNIQILRGLPASKLPEVMGGFTQALGVPCTQCHVSGHFELDEKADKQIARKMVQMTAKLNDENFQQARNVTCWICHRGTLKPEESPR